MYVVTFFQTYIDVLRQYYFIGEMPEAMQSFAEEKNFGEVRSIQKYIWAAYEQDFYKHAPNEIAPRIRMVWNSISSRLTPPNTKSLRGYKEKNNPERCVRTSMADDKAEDWLVNLPLYMIYDRGNLMRLSRTHPPVFIAPAFATSRPSRD